MADSALRLKLISGGQTGVDRAALDAGLECGVEVGGDCPRGREAEDGTIPDKYPLTEIDGGYAERTRSNVRQADATLIIYDSQLTGGTLRTLAECIEQERPFKLIDASLVTAVVAAQAVEEFIRQAGVRVLNVAGPRASSNAALYEFTYQILRMYLNEQELTKSMD